MRPQDYFGHGDVGFRKYNDHLEKIEDLVFNLVNEINVEENLLLVEQYRRQLTSAITHSQQIEDEEILREIEADHRRNSPTNENKPAKEHASSKSDQYKDSLFIFDRNKLKPVSGDPNNGTEWQKKLKVFTFSDKETSYYNLKNQSSQAGGWKADWLWKKCLDHIAHIGGLLQTKVWTE